MAGALIDECVRLLEQQSRSLQGGLLAPQAQLPLLREVMRSILEFEPREIIAALERFASEPRVLLSWLLYEGGRLPGVDQAKVAQVRGLWDEACRLGQRVITVPPAAAGEARAA